MIKLQKILPTFLGKFRDPFSLGDTDSGLEICGFEIITDMGIDILVIISLGQTPQMPTKALCTGIGLARSAPAVPPPITQGAGDLGKPDLVHDHSTSLTQCNVMGREKTQSAHIPEGSD
jgi:hypothetical protein